MRRTITTVLCTAGILAAFSPAAFGDTSVGRASADLNHPNNTALSYWGDAGTDDLDVTLGVGGDLVFQDDFDAVVADHGCNQVDVHTVTCSQTNLDELRIDASNGTNIVDVEDDVSVRSKIFGGTGIDYLTGGDGTVLIRGFGGEDFLHGGDNADPSDQVLEGGPDGDHIYAGPGHDQLFGDGGDDFLQPQAGPDKVYGGAGTDEVSYFGTGQGVTVSLDSQPNDGTPGEGDNVSEDVEDIDGTAHGDHLIGNDKANELDGRNGSDTIEGLENDDTLIAGAGDDDILGGADGDLVHAGANDDDIDGGSGNDYLLGELGLDEVRGGSGNDVLDGGLGTDLLEGGLGDFDNAYYGTRSQPITATLGAGGGTAGENDTFDDTVEILTGGSSDDTLTGNDGPDLLRGGAGADTLDGLAGDDLLQGQVGDDTLLSSGDGALDADDCGDGNDAVTADPGDTLTDCEQIQVVQPPGQGGGGEPVVPGGGPDTPPTPIPPVVVVDLAGPKVGIANRVVRVGRSRIAAIRLTCPATAQVRCVGTLTLARSNKTLGTKSFSIASGRSAVVKVRVQRLRRTRRAVKVQALASARAEGTMAATSRRTLKMRRAG